LLNPADEVRDAAGCGGTRRELRAVQRPVVSDVHREAGTAGQTVEIAVSMPRDPSTIHIVVAPLWRGGGPMKLRESIQNVGPVLGVFFVTLVVLANPLTAVSACASAVAGVLPDAAPDSLMVLHPPRTADAVNQDLAQASARESTANTDLVSAQGRLAEAKARVDVCQSEIEAIKAKIKLAKEQKNASEQAGFEQQAKAKELQLAVLKARVEMRDAEVAFADTRRLAAQTESAFLKKELELVGKRSDLARLGSSPGGTANLDGLTRLQTEVRDLERHCLEALKDFADKEKKAAEDEATLLEKRLKLQEAQLGLVAGPKK
jgi:hypothetical protein